MTDTLIDDGTPQTQIITSGDGTVFIETQNTGDVLIAENTATTVIQGPTTGPNGAIFVAGTPGQPGPPGAAAAGAYYSETNFASAAYTWTITLPVGISSYATNIDTLTSGGDVIHGEVTRPDASTIEVDWYYPTAGIARVYR